MNSKINAPKIAIISQEDFQINGTIISVRSTCEDYSGAVNPRYYNLNLVNFLNVHFINIIK